MKSRKFFRSQSLRNKVVEYVGPEFADIMSELLENDRIILALINSSQEIDVEKMQKVCLCFLGSLGMEAALEDSI